MKKIIGMPLVFNFGIFLIIPLFSIILISDKASAQDTGSSSFIEMSSIYQEVWNENDNKTGKTIFPVIIVDGFKYELRLSEGNIKSFTGPVGPYNELNAVAQVGPALFAMGAPYWKNDADLDWKTQMQEFERELNGALQSVKSIDWSNDAWPQGAAKLEQSMQKSLEYAHGFTKTVLKNGKYPIEDYDNFASRYSPVMARAMYLADLANTTYTINNLKQWKQELGQENWDEIVVVIIGKHGKQTAGLTIENNPAAKMIASLMKESLARENIMIAPTAESGDDAVQIIGNLISEREFAKKTFRSAGTNSDTAIYDALNNPTTTPALKNVDKIINAINSGESAQPVLSFEPNDS